MFGIPSVCLTQNFEGFMLYVFFSCVELARLDGEDFYFYILAGKKNDHQIFVNGIRIHQNPLKTKIVQMYLTLF